MTTPSDAIALAQALIRCPSVTPEDAGVLGVVEAALKPLGFACQRLRFENVENLYARLGTAPPNFCFAGHTDVVPAGDHASWRHDPFAAEIKDGVLYGRGAADMKGGIAAFIAAVANYLKAYGAPKGSISLLISGDEEGPGTNGTVKVLQWLKANNEALDHCLVGEPTANVRAGDVIKIGRRGSINFRVDVRGRQGHAAYPQHALNPIPILAELVRRLSALKLDAGSEHFEPTTLAFTSVDVGNPISNVTPAMVLAAFNIRFNDRHTADKLVAQVAVIAKDVTSAMGGEISFEHRATAAPFLTQPGPYIELLAAAVTRVTGSAPQFSTGGGTSDARFIKEHCPVAELGLPGRTIHKSDENLAVADIERLRQIYEAVLETYFASTSAK
jgi:succinyl-diaminopimelate desuccinylase